jgi:predicted nucleic acid-binding protein
VNLIVDTGPLVALLNRRDRLHGWVQEVLAGYAPPLWSCEPVLAEVAHLSRRPADVVAMVATGAVRIGLSVQDQAPYLERLLRKYEGRMDLADACIVRLSEMNREHRVLTADRDFAIYRRYGRDVIPLILPGN